MLALSKEGSEQSGGGTIEHTVASYVAAKHKENFSPPSLE